MLNWAISLNLSYNELGLINFVTRYLANTIKPEVAHETGSYKFLTSFRDKTVNYEMKL